MIHMFTMTIFINKKHTFSIKGILSTVRSEGGSSQEGAQTFTSQSSPLVARIGICG